MKLNKSGESIGHIGADKDDYKYREKLKTDFGPRSDTGWDVVDKENYYNESGFADSKMENYYFQEIVDENELEPEMQELMDKYGFEEEWELNDWAKKCDAYLNGNVKVSPLKNETEVAELAGFYRDRVVAESPDGLPLTSEERARLSDDDLERLSELFDVLSEFRAKEGNKDEIDQSRQDFVTDPKEHKNKVNDRSALRRSVNELNQFNTKVGQAQREIEAIMARSKQEKPEKEKTAKDERRELMKGKPEYTTEELKLLESCYNWMTKQSEAEQPTFANKANEVLTEQQILDGAQEYAEYRKVPRTRFFEHNFKGKRQLTFTEKTKSGNKLKLIALSENLPKGMYYYHLDPDNFWQGKDPKTAFAKVNLLFSAERGKKKKGHFKKRSA